MKKDLVTQDNSLLNASYTLDLVEKRLILLAIARSRKSGKGITAENYLEIRAEDYAEAFNVERQASYMALKTASKNLFDRYFTYESRTKKGNRAVHNSRWTAEIIYIENESTVKIIFSPAVVPFITDLEKHFTSYFINDVKNLTSVYAIRLYELIIAWRSRLKTPVFELAEFRNKLGIKEHEYPRMYDFKKRVLDIACSQINEHTNIRIKVSQHKKGRSISGFSFTFQETASKGNNNSGDGALIKKRRRKITQHEAEKMGKVGETWEQLIARLAPDYIILFKDGKS